MKNIKKIILSRTDSIGDVILSLPLAGVLKELLPESEIIFLSNSYTKEIVNASEHIDGFINWDELKKLNETDIIKKFKKIKADVIIHVFPKKEIARIAKKAKIKYRLGTTGRLYHWIKCNKLILLSRRHSSFHEAQLNLKLIEPLGSKKLFKLEEIPAYYGLSKIKHLNKNLTKLLSADKFNLILHPKSKGSAREWGVFNFAELINILPQDKFNIFITGTQEESLLIKKDLIDKFSFVTDLTGKLSLDELLSFIAKADGIVAASTGPLHIASALGKYAIGIYPPIKPMHPGRWAPVGLNASFVVINKKCNKCRNAKKCDCIESISPEIVKDRLMNIIEAGK
ncbi:MAG: glycosyltransferase family 9 protein [Bacteroidales bacterium]|nr:glycosyltransferase family 9 protein [Bacteroidales bacterium]